MSKELKPCPFCGRKAFIELNDNYECDCISIMCRCGGSMTKSYRELPAFNIPDDVRDEMEEDLMMYADEGRITGLAPLFEAWNRRAS